jgi:iron-sulfur cluster insertion protein
MEATAVSAGIAISERAAQMVTSVFKEQGAEGSALRVFVAGQSCSGLKYGLAVEDTINPDDTEFVHFGVRIVVDADSLGQMDGSTVDYVEAEGNSGFKIDNPNIPSNCGGCSCGSGGCG